MKPAHVYQILIRRLTTAGQHGQSVLLLILRLWWGWSFFLTGRGKLLHLDRTAEYFASLSIPLPKLNALAAGTVECLGGALLILGLGTPLATTLLIFTLIVAYATAERDALLALASDPDRFTSAAPFLFLLTCLVVFTFGPGKLSLSHLWSSRGSRADGQND